jgi:hypothetical protein
MQTSDLPGYPEFAHDLDERGLNKGTFAVSASRGDGGALVGILVRWTSPRRVRSEHHAASGMKGPPACRRPGSAGDAGAGAGRLTQSGRDPGGDQSSGHAGDDRLDHLRSWLDPNGSAAAAIHLNVEASADPGVQVR